MVAIDSTNVINIKIDKVTADLFNSKHVKNLRDWLDHFKEIIVLGRDISFMEKELKFAVRHYDLLELSQKIEAYADFSYNVERTTESIIKKMTSKPATSFLDSLFYSHVNRFVKILNKANKTFFALTYPDSKSLDDPEYVAQLDKDYSNAPQFNK